jgi:methylated-DNA-protein-cysteine methyltransferase-like protein
MLTGKIHFGSPTRMQALLEAEGVEIIQDKVVKFEALFWDPATHIDDDMLQIALFGS